MDNNLEKRIQQEEFNATPKNILENYFQLTDDLVTIKEICTTRNVGVSDIIELD